MPIHLYLAPAGAGKTTYLLDLAREGSHGLQAEVRVCVSSRLQARSWRSRLAETGGALGVYVMTFGQLVEACLRAAGETYTELAEPVQYRLIQILLEEVPLKHYASLVDRPGFVQVLQELFAELKGARIWPEQFTAAVSALGGRPRLGELAKLYAAYQVRLQESGWADRAGLGWLAVESLQERAPNAAREWPLLLVDGFDSFTEAQRALLELLAQRVESFIITLTGSTNRPELRAAHRRFHKTRLKLEQALGVRAEPLPRRWVAYAPGLAHLETNLFTGRADQAHAEEAVTLVEGPDRATEVREALRWLKERIVHDRCPSGAVALLARDLPPYRPFIVETAAEFGLPIRLIDGLPLAANPAVAALLDLLRLVLPREEGETDWDLPRRGIIEAWRSPYFDWANPLPAADADVPIGIVPGDAEALDEAARWGRVIGGLAQWQELLTVLPGRSGGESDDDELKLPANLPTGAEAQELADKFLRFLQRIIPPQGDHSYRAFVAWLEELIGPDPELQGHDEAAAASTSLDVIARARQADEMAGDLDVAALQAFKEILRSLVWIEESLAAGRLITFSRFFADLAAAVEARSYQPPLLVSHEAILVANVIQARGVPFQAVAIVGLAEGEFPATLVEDPFLRETDRQSLREEHGLPLESSIESAEREFFYEAVTRPWEQLLLTRPRLADTGAEWPPSPFWEEVRRLLLIEPVQLTTDSVPAPQRAASWPELLESLVVYGEHQAARKWALAEDHGRWEAVLQAAEIFGRRYSLSGQPEAHTPFDGDLSSQAHIFTVHFHPDYGWSPSGLETYRNCPFSFFVGRVLGLEARQEPTEGLDGAQLGTLYHQILEELYQGLDSAERTDGDSLQSRLPLVAQRVFEEAPRQLGFRETAWWQETQSEILDKLARSLVALVELASDFVPVRFEARFFGAYSLIVIQGDDRFRLHGVIDRIDRDPAGQLRVIDYKTSSPYAYSSKTLDRGEKLQLPLYALAARDALNLGQPVEGFYWHVQHAEASELKLEDYGPEAAIQTAIDYAWQAVRGARQGHFVPEPPATGCPNYCPAAGFCWRYRPSSWGK